MNKTAGKIVSLIAAVIFVSCGIFSPRDSAQPDPPGRTDPLNFAAIMDSSGYHFSKLQYEDLFSESVVYTDINSSSFYKSQLVQKLQLIQRQNADIEVQWNWIGGTTIWKPNDTIYLNGLQYLIFVKGVLSAPPDDSGSSDFIMVRENADWHICLWRDYPARQGRSFFSPP